MAITHNLFSQYSLYRNDEELPLWEEGREFTKRNLIINIFVIIHTETIQTKSLASFIKYL